MQRAAIERAATTRRDHISEWFAEKRSAKTLIRPELDKLRAAVRAGNFDRLYVYRLDRLTRSGIRDTLDVVEELRAAGCELVTIGDGFDINGPAAEVILAVMAWAAQMERLAINERIAGARLRLEEEGRTWGRPSVVDEGVLRRIRDLRTAGRSVRDIAMVVRKSRSAVFRALSRKDTPKMGPRKARQSAINQGSVR